MARAATANRRAQEAEVLDPTQEDLALVDQSPGPPRAVRLECLADHKYGTTLPTVQNDDGEPEYKPKGKATALMGFRAGKVYAVAADVALRLLRDYGPYVRKKGTPVRPVKFRAVDPDELSEALNERVRQVEEIEETPLDRDQPVAAGPTRFDNGEA